VGLWSRPADEAPWTKNRLGQVGPGSDENQWSQIASGQRVGQPHKLLLFSRTGFTAGVADEAVVRADVELIGIDRLYDGS
jgi:hypothetical protein